MYCVQTGLGEDFEKHFYGDFRNVRCQIYIFIELITCTDPSEHNESEKLLIFRHINVSLSLPLDSMPASFPTITPIKLIYPKF